jgi:hypothetical protein
MTYCQTIVQTLIVNAMDSTQNLSIINNINLVIQKISNNFVNKLSFGVISAQHLNEAKLLYLYRRVLEVSLKVIILQTTNTMKYI